VGEQGVSVKEISRVLRRLRREVYREIPAASSNRVVEIDWRASWDALADRFAGGDCGVMAQGAALALWRAATDAGFRAWCYEFGFAETFTHSVTVIEADGALEAHDAFLNHGFRAGLLEILDGLRRDRAPELRREIRDRKIYVSDPAHDSRQALDWLVVHADRELDPVGSLRRFELRWDEAALIAADPRLDAVYRELEAHGHPADLAYLMLHPIAVFDGAARHCEQRQMPLIGGRDLLSPTAAVRRLTRELVAEREQAAERRVATERLEAELRDTRTRFATAGDGADRLSIEVAALRAALAREAEHRVTEAELAAAKAEIAAAAERAAELDRRIAELQAEQDRRAAAWQSERQSLAAMVAAADAERQRLAAGAAAREQDLAAAREELAAAEHFLASRTEQWQAERAALEMARDDAANQAAGSRATLAQATAQLAAVRVQLGDWRQTLARSAREWACERSSLRATAETLDDDNRQLEAAVAQAHEDTTATRAQLAVATDELSRRSAEWEAERSRLQAATRPPASRRRGIGLGLVRRFWQRSAVAKPELRAPGRTP
jgi:hypothetical protein